MSDLETIIGGRRYIKRVQRQCARDHANYDLITVMQQAMHEAIGEGYAVEYYKQLRSDRFDRPWAADCLPWPLIKVEEVRRVYNTKSDCWLSIEVTYGKDGERAIYGIVGIGPDTGKVRLWAD